MEEADLPLDVKVLTYNIHRGRSVIRRRDVLTEIGRVLEEADADVLCLQEVWRRHGLTEHQLEQASKERWGHGRFQVNAFFPRGAQGNAVISRWPILKEEHLDLSLPGRERRGLLHVVIAPGGGQRRLHVFCTHFGLSRHERLHQAELTRNYLARKLRDGEAAILAGDFNDWRGRMVPSVVAEAGFVDAHARVHGHAVATYPAILPIWPLDRLFVRSLIPIEVRCLAHYRRLSDHLPLIGRFVSRVTPSR